MLAFRHKHCLGSGPAGNQDPWDSLTFKARRREYVGLCNNIDTGVVVVADVVSNTSSREMRSLSRVQVYIYIFNAYGPR